MPCNANGVCNTATASGQYVYVNGVYVMALASSGGLTGAQRASIVADRLNNIFQDWASSNRDLDFITPSYAGGNYIITCPYVQKNNSSLGPTYFKVPNCGYSCPPDGYPTNNTGICAPGSTRCLPENMYNANNNTDSRTTTQTLIATVTNEDAALYSMARWDVAIQWANAIRAYLNGAVDSLGRTVRTLTYPSYASGESGKQIYQGPGTYYGTPNQGTYQSQPNNLCCATVANGIDIFHPCDLTIAIRTDLYNLYHDKWVWVSYGDKPPIVARIIDSSGPTGPADLAYCGVAVPLGFPGSGTVTVTLV